MITIFSVLSGNWSHGYYASGQTKVPFAAAAAGQKLKIHEASAYHENQPASKHDINRIQFIFSQQQE